MGRSLTEVVGGCLRFTRASLLLSMSEGSGREVDVWKGRVVLDGKERKGIVKGVEAVGNRAGGSRDAQRLYRTDVSEPEAHFVGFPCVTLFPGVFAKDDSSKCPDTRRSRDEK